MCWRWRRRRSLIAVAVAVAEAARRGRRGPALVALSVPAGLVLTPPSLSGHARARTAASRWAADVAHVAAASLWTGGLLAVLVLALLLAGAVRWPLAAGAVPRSSILAGGSVVALLLAGAVNAYEQVETWRGLWETTYGLLLLAKIALVLPCWPSARTTTASRCRASRRGAPRRGARRFLRTAGPSSHFSSPSPR